MEKRFSDSFRKTSLREILDSLGVRKLIVTGLQTEYCVGATSLAARELGYQVTLVTDAHSTFDGPVVSAEGMIEHCCRIFAERGIEMKPARELSL